MKLHIGIYILYHITGAVRRKTKVEVVANRKISFSKASLIGACDIRSRKKSWENKKSGPLCSLAVEFLC